MKRQLTIAALVAAYAALALLQSACSTLSAADRAMLANSYPNTPAIQEHQP